MLVAVTSLIFAPLASQGSGAAVAERTTSASGGQARLVGTAAPENCAGARKAVKFYAGRIAYWRDRMGQQSSRVARRTGCPTYLAHVLQRKARAARAEYLYHWAFRSWMPGWMIRLAQCEMELDWARRWGVYEGAFAFYVGTWDQYRLPGYPASAADATPRQQMIVALRVARAVTVGSAWGCWRGPQHAWVRGGLPESGFRG